MYNKAHTADNTVESRYAEKLADVLYEIGEDMSRKKDFQNAAKWLSRAQDVINNQDIGQLSREALELRTAILQAHVSALLHLDTNEDLEKAQNLIDLMQSEMGNTLVVLVLRLDVLNKVPPEVFDSSAYAAVLGQMITSMKQLDVEMDPVTTTVTEPAFGLINHHIGKLHSRNPKLGCTVMDEFISALAETQHEGWVERLVTRRIWMATSNPDSIASIEAVQASLSCLRNPMSAEATIAIQTLLWKSLESVYNQGLYDVVERWCQLALNPVFVNSGPSNRAKIERKYLLCAIAKNDLDGARSIHHSMADETKADPRTWYLMYKVAIRNSDQELATTCLENISRQPNPLEYLYACCVDATSCTNKEYATETLTTLLEASNESSCSSLHLPALLRCTIRLHLQNYKKSSDEEQKFSIVERLCDAFDQVDAHVQRDVKDANGNKVFDVKELDWFGRNSYNLALENIDNWDVSHTIRILTTCVEIMSHYPPDVSSEVALDLKQRALFSNFIIATALLARARAADNVESQLQDYLEMRKHVAAYDSELPAQLPALVGEARNDMLQKLATLLAFDFEGAIRLKSWESLVEIVRKTAECKNVTTLQGMADCLLRSDAPVKVTYTTLRQIINQIYELESLDGVKLSRYMRCLFQVTLPFEDELALGLADEYIDLIQNAKRNTVPLPPEELEWLATTAFNHAVDFYFAKQDRLCQKWAFKAFALAHLYEDGGALEKMLHDRYGTLKFDAAE
ncbi:hypothetical protein DL546_001180 [Coniochaeta pulveracea]|nr:hypothetical protein DL546_001180 [Coniochaeta pulveracea]